MRIDADHDSLCLSVNVTQQGTYTVTYVNNDADTASREYFTDTAKMLAFIADCVKRGFSLS